ncbi:MAG TPA: aldo/keto reductase [Streptosporangiaceae bacterium]|nr:aldo/keto reductase [Streptosporangiaceae bacterium]
MTSGGVAGALSRRLGALGRDVGRVGLGCVGMSAEYAPAEIDEEWSRQVLARAVQLGVRFFDTADVYGPFTNERLVGGALGGLGRDDLLIATKAGLVIDETTGHSCPRGDPAYLRTACDASLSRLGVDAIDLYYLHRVDPQVPIEESWGALANLVAAGKVRALGLSEVTAAQLDLAQAIHPVASVQSELSLWTRGPLDQIVPWCQAHGALFAAYAPLGRGYLTGSVRSSGFEPTDIRFANPRFTGEAISTNQAILAVIEGVAKRHAATLGQVAIAWTLAQGEHVLPIPGTKRLNYLEENIAAASLSLSEADLAALDAAPPAMGARY